MIRFVYMITDHTTLISLIKENTDQTQVWFCLLSRGGCTPCAYYPGTQKSHNKCVQTSVRAVNTDRVRKLLLCEIWTYCAGACYRLDLVSKITLVSGVDVPHTYQIWRAAYNSYTHSQISNPSTKSSSDCWLLLCTSTAWLDWAMLASITGNRFVCCLWLQSVV